MSDRFRSLQVCPPLFDVCAAPGSIDLPTAARQAAMIASSPRGLALLLDADAALLPQPLQPGVSFQRLLARVREDLRNTPSVESEEPLGIIHWFSSLL